jgi:hypothetical protein
MRLALGEPKKLYSTKAGSSRTDKELTSEVKFGSSAIELQDRIFSTL